MTNKIIEAALAARIGVLSQKFGFVVYGDVTVKDLARFYAIARAEALEDAAKAAFDADHMGSVNLKLMKNRIGNAIRALKEQQHG